VGDLLDSLREAGAEQQATALHGDQRGRRSGQGQLVYQRRRPAVQQVRVINEHHERAAPAHLS
jgi:hypothetical protein